MTQAYRKRIAEGSIQIILARIEAEPGNSREGELIKLSQALDYLWGHRYDRALELVAESQKSPERSEAFGSRSPVPTVAQLYEKLARSRQRSAPLG